MLKTTKPNIAKEQLDEDELRSSIAQREVRGGGFSIVHRSWMSNPLIVAGVDHFMKEVRVQLGYDTPVHIGHEAGPRRHREHV